MIRFLKKTGLSLLDIYFAYCLPIDFVLCVMIFLIPDKYICFKLLDEANHLNLVNSIIGTCVSLAGFIIAALTIIVTFKSSIAAKGLQDATNALELIVSSRLYPKIVNAYAVSILEFFLISITLFICWLLFRNLPSIFYQIKLVASAIICTALTFGRTLWILFQVLKAEQADKLSKQVI